MKSNEHLWSLLRRPLEKKSFRVRLFRDFKSTKVRFVCFQCTQEYFKKMKQPRLEKQPAG